ncbi:uncharacterized protein LAESUDRAFT_686700 [Laetiporus sulphureus 93-53]|uniref:Ctf8-domain-containing protein n=1 Tax=Laetiporus sulphureus 93-53 TaxID=1314785 RepID=A0A165BNU9_9APHY|nr:uncharacterized protein LAESUDRAFT_686700 [Laetiporus sulphureus 93-53]KZT01384.1 hypothetical protein LAESUDRAFT_686700 [Laetiporus sulphureus 93-53]
MIIPINISAPSSSSSSSQIFPPQLAQFGSDELVLIELQGSLEVKGDREGQVVGKLRIDDATQKPTLLIGYHLLEGRLVNLPKPLAVLHRRSLPSDAHDDIPMDDVDASKRRSSEKGWDVVAIVKRKMVFSKRPMPMVSKPATPASESQSGKKGT